MIVFSILNDPMDREIEVEIEVEVEMEDKKQLKRQFQDMADKAKELYPNIDQSIAIMNNITAQTINIQDYLNLTNQSPPEISNNHVVIP